MPSQSRHVGPSASAGVLTVAWWVRDRDGRVVLAQWPNPALVVWLVALVVGWTEVLGPARSTQVAGLGRGALVVWALDELVRGANPVRRVLGAVVLTWQLATLWDGTG